MRAYLEIDMPKSCSDCDLSYDCLGCSATCTGFSGIGYQKGRLPNCPLKAKPESAEEAFKLIIEEYGKSPFNQKEMCPIFTYDEYCPQDDCPLETKSMDFGTLADWYISSIAEDVPPVWTEEHIEELLNDFYVIPKEEGDTA